MKRNGLEIQCKERCSHGHHLLGTKTNHSGGRDRLLQELRVWWAGSLGPRHPGPGLKAVRASHLVVHCSTQQCAGASLPQQGTCHQVRMGAGSGWGGAGGWRSMKTVVCSELSAPHWNPKPDRCWEGGCARPPGHTCSQL